MGLKINNKSVIKYSARVLLALNIIIMIFLRSKLPLVNNN
jgi:hypothetical protein